MGALPPLTLETSLEVIVNVEASRAAEGKLLLSYWMNNAGWNPSYNARVSDITEPLKLEYQAMVYQNTGESWEGVGLSIATGTPSKNRSKPQLQPWSLDGAAAQQLGQSTANAWLKAKPYNPNVNQIRGQLYDANGQPLIGAQVTVGGNRAVTDINGFYSIGVPAGVSTVQYQSIGRRVETLNVSDPVMNVSLTDVDVMMDAVMIAEEVADEREALFSPRAKRRSEFNANESMDFAPVAVEHNPTQTRFDVSAHYDIPADGQPHAVRVLEHQLPVDYLYQCTPKLDPQVYLTALFTDWEELDLINGRMHIYFEANCGWISRRIRWPFHWGPIRPSKCAASERCARTVPASSAANANSSVNTSSRPPIEKKRPSTFKSTTNCPSRITKKSKSTASNWTAQRSTKPPAGLSGTWRSNQAMKSNAPSATRSNPRRNCTSE